MGKRQKEGILPFRVVQGDAALVARGGLALPYEFARSLKLPRVIDEELPRPGSGRGYRPSAFVMPMVLMLHGGGKKLEDLREVKGEKSLRELLEMDGLPVSCTVGDWAAEDGRGWGGSCWSGEGEQACSNGDDKARQGEGVHAGCGCQHNRGGEGRG